MLAYVYFFIFLITYTEYICLCYILNKFFDIKLDMFPDRYYDNPKRTWRNAGVLIACFLITALIAYGLGFLD